VPSLLRKVASNSVGFLAGRSLAGVAGVLLLRALGPEQSGVYGGALGFAAIFSVGATLGLDSALAGAIGRDPSSAATRWSAGLLMVLSQGAVTAVLLALFLRAGGGALVPPGLVLLAFAVLLVNALGQVSELTWQAPTRASLAASWRLALPFALLTLSAMIFLKVDQALLAHLVPAAALGLYVAAVRLVDLLVPALMALITPLHPHLAAHFSRAAAGDAEAWPQARRALALGLRYLAALCWPLGVGGSLLAPLIVRALYGAAFDGAGPVFALLVWVAALIGLQGALMQSVHGLGRTSLLSWLYAAGLALNVGLNLWLIPHFGILASAWLSVLGECVNLAFLWAWCARRGLGLGWRSLLWPSLPAALGMGAALAWLGLPLVAGLPAAAAAGILIVAGAAAYAGLLAALGFIGADERQLWRRLTGRPA
jgi:O-antigen/teichoic acid export membrane protein